MVYRCRYCGSYALNPDTGNDDPYDEYSVYKCSHCGIMCTQNEAEMFDRPAPNSSREQTAASAERIPLITVQSEDPDSAERIPLITVQSADPDSAERIPLITVQSADPDSAGSLSLRPFKHEDPDSAGSLPFQPFNHEDPDSSHAVALNIFADLFETHATSLNKSAGPGRAHAVSLNKSADPGGARAVSLNKCADPDSSAADPLNEYERLVDAWTAMKNGEWSAALELLNQAQPPLTYPPEYLILGSICRAVPLFQAPQNLLHLRCRQLLILINNINCLDFYLSEDEDRDFAALEHIYAALLLLGRQPVKKHQTIIGDQTDYLRANAISAFAALLKNRAQTAAKVQYHTAYLKMAVRLLHQCLEFSKEKPVLFVALKENELNLPTKDRLRINAEIKHLNAAICQRDPDFVPVRPPSVPLAQLISSINLSLNEVMGLLGLLFIIVTSVGVGIMAIIMDDGSGLISFLGCFYMFGQLAMFGIPIIYHIRNGTIIKSFDDL